MLHGGEVYDKEIELDFSVSLNPCGCPDKVKNALSGAICDVDKYPDMSQQRFREAVARAESADEILPENIIGGNGASELLAAIVNMLRPKKALLPVPSFYGYIHAIGMAKDCQVVTYKLSEDREFELDERFVEEIAADIDFVILGNPNNPTGKCIKRSVLEAIIKKCKETETALVVDECFFRLSDHGTSARTYLDSYDNLYVVDAYTKLFSIPGVRVGFCLSQPENIEKLRRFLPEWNMSLFAQTAGIACAEMISENFMDVTAETIKKEREYLDSELRKLGIKVFDSDTNFILIKVPDDLKPSINHNEMFGASLYDALLEKRILIRDCSTFDGLSCGFYRIAVKDHESNIRLLDALSDVR